MSPSQGPRRSRPPICPLGALALGAFLACCVLPRFAGGQVRVPAGADSLAAPAPAPPDSFSLPATAAPSGAPAGPGPGGTRVRADRLVDQLLGGEPVTFLFGDVLVDRDTLTVRSDSALYYRQREVFDFRGRVEIRSRRGVLTSRRAEFRRLEDAADSEGNVRVDEEGVVGTSARAESRGGGSLLRLIGEARLVSPEYTVWADTIVRMRESDLGEAFGQVKLLDPESRTLVTGEHATFQRHEGNAVVDRSPSLTTRDQGEGTLTGTARVMRFQRDPERVVMIDSVRIRQTVTEATADTAVILGRERVLLRGAPRVRDSQRSTMTGREIEFLYRDGVLDQVLLQGAARVEDTQPDSLAALHPGLPGMNVLEGDTITVEFAEGRPRRSTVIGTAHSIYVPEDVEDEVAYNDVRGDTMVIDFRRGRVDIVRVRGEMSGSYYFVRRADLAQGKAAGADTVARAAPGPEAVAPSPADSAAAAPAGGEPTQGFDFAAHRETVTYSGRSVEFRLAERRIEIDRQAGLTYGDLDLTAEHVRFDIAARELYASGDPLLEDSAQKIAGDRMGYNFAYHVGAVRGGVTAEEGSYYGGREIRRFADGSLKIRSGRMTSCDLARPHYHFWADKMRIKLNDKVVAAPVVLKVGEVPLFALPFYFKSLKEGRRSGILFPNFGFGWSRRDGRYIRDWGYYWATNDYLDFTLRGDYNERRDLALRLTNRYVKRYAFQGGLDWSRRYQFGSTTQSSLREWQLSWNHSQETLFDVYTLRSDVRLASRTLSRNDLSSSVTRDIVSGQLHSTVYLSRNWKDLSSTLNLTRDEQVNAADDNPATNNVLSTTILPQLSLSFRRRPVLSPLASGARGSAGGDMLRSMYFSHSYNLGRTRVVNELSNVTTTTARGGLTMELRPPRIGFLNVSTGLQAGQSWRRVATSGLAYVGPDTTYTDPDSALVINHVFRDATAQQETTSPSLSVTSTAGTTLYGVLPARLGQLRAIRHTLSFSVGHSWRPALGAKQEGSSTFSFSLGNRFDLKFAGSGEKKPGQDGVSDDTAAAGAAAAGAGAQGRQAVRKLDGVLDWRLSTAYNPNLPTGRQWSTISSGLAIKPGQSRYLSFKVDNSINPYSLKILSTRLNYGLNVSGRLETGGEVIAAEAERSEAIDRLGAPADTTGAVPSEGAVPADAQEQDSLEGEFAGFAQFRGRQEGKDPTEGGRFIPWNVSSSISYNRNHETGTQTARASLALSANLTRSWDFTYSTAIDLGTGAMTRQTWSLNRDLHCWALEFSRVVSTIDSQFGFRIYLKSTPAVEVTRGNRDLMQSVGQLGGGGIF